MRFGAAIVLGYFRVSAAYKIICEALKDKSAYYRAGAVRSLAELNGKKHMDLIISTLKDSDYKVRKTALKVFLNVARNEIAFLANCLELPLTPESIINEYHFPKTEILNALKDDYLRKLKVDANRIDVNIIYEILLMIDKVEIRARIMQELHTMKKLTESEEDSRLHFFQREEDESEEIIIDDAARF